MADHSPSDASEREDVPVFSVVLVFEDFHTGQRAQRAYDFLAANLTQEWQVTSQMWKFGLLSIPELRALAAKDAARANLIIVSSRGDRELPSEVKDWIEMWQGLNGEPVALVALFDRPPEQAPYAETTQAYLKRAAERGHMEFFAWPGIEMEQQSPQETVGLDRHSAMADEPFLPVVVIPSRETSFSHWGINE